MARYKFSKGAENAILMADRICKNTQCTYTGTEHILAGLMSADCIARKILLREGVNSSKFFEVFKRSIDPSYAINGFTPRVKNTLETANRLANVTNGGYIATEHLLIGLIAEGGSTARKILGVLNINLDNVVKDVENELGVKITITLDDDMSSFTNEVGSIMRDMGMGTPQRNSTFGSERVANYSNASNVQRGGGEHPNASGQQGDEQIKFGIDLTQLAKEGKLDPVIGRQKEIERIIQILSRRTKNNPVLVGEPGVGKTAVIEGLADKIVKGDVPEMLKNKVVFSLDIGGMLAGAKYRGDFEERLKEFLDEVKSRKNIIIFIDEIHNIVGAGASTDSNMDAAEILKPMLARGELQTVGATTIDEYRKYIEKDPALERRFQPIMVDQPSVKDTIEILKGVRDKYEAHHKITITDEAIVAAAELSDRYIMDRFLPDKAIDLIDEASSRARLDTAIAPPAFKELEEKIDELTNMKSGCLRREDYIGADNIKQEIDKVKEELDKKRREWTNSRGKTSSIGADEVANIVALWTSIPVKKITQTEAQKLINLENVLHKRVIGQEEAVIATSKAIRRARAGLKDPKRPIGSFIFVGPTGVGKTELSKALAEAVFGDEDLMIRVDMSEFMEKHSVSKLVGAPPGYVGFDENGQLTEKVRRKPYSVILFDEIEKAHPDVFNILLQILEDGRLTDSKGRLIDFKNTIIIMTSNVGASQIAKISKLGFGEDKTELDHENMKEQIMDALKSNFKPEFLNRIDDIIVFHHLNKEETAKIAELMLVNLTKRLKENGIELEITQEAKDVIIGEGYDSEYGARPLRRAIQKMVEDRLSEEILKGNIAFGDKVKVGGEDNKLTFVRV